MLSYVSLSQEIQNYKDRVHSQEELYNILEKCFSKIKGEKMVYEQFKKVIENENSDIYLMILLFLYEKKPFTKATLSAYMKKSKKSPLNSPPKSPSKIIASPSKNSSFSPYNFFKRERKRTNTLKEELFEKKEDDEPQDNIKPDFRKPIIPNNNNNELGPKDSQEEYFSPDNNYNITN